MSFKVTFLSSNRPLTKSFVQTSDGLDITPYPLSSEMTSHVEVINTIEDFYAQILAHGNFGRALLKGNLTRDIRNESRAGLTKPEASWWLLCDFDGLGLKGKTVDEMLVEIGLGGVDYILQYSASQGLKPGFNAHIWILLKEPEGSEDLKNFLRWKNLSVPFLREQLSLTKTGLSLRWPLDVTVADNSRLVYIAPPEIVGLPDPCSERCTLHKRESRAITLPKCPGNLQQQVLDMVKQLRTTAGLPDHDLKLKHFKSEYVDVISNPDRVSITGIKEHGDFTYLNINGGRNWSYYFRTSNPEILFNFKDEPPCLLRVCAPDLYSERKRKAKHSKTEYHLPKESDESAYFIINRKDEGRYYKVSYSKNRGLELDPAPTLKHCEDFCQLHKIPMTDMIESWDVKFDPTNLTNINTEERVINIYRPTKYKFARSDISEIPEKYRKLIKFVCGSDDEATERFINWIAYMWQTGKKPKTAWVLHGTYGTGKGRLQLVLSHLFGDQCVVTSPESVTEHFNASIERAQILWIDEVTTDAWDNNKITPKLRNWITEDTITLRGMRKDAKPVPNYMGIIIAANEHNPVEIQFGDRRFNVAPRQESRLRDQIWANDELLDTDQGWLYQEENLKDFAAALTNYAVDTSLVRIPMENEAKENVMRVTQNLPEDIVLALNQGRVSFFLEHILTDRPLHTMEAADYKAVVAKMMEGGRVGLSTREISKLFEFLVGWNQAVGRFSKAVARYGLALSGKTCRYKDKVSSGTYFNFIVTQEDKIHWASIHDDSELQIVRAARDKS